MSQDNNLQGEIIFVDIICGRNKTFIPQINKRLLFLDEIRTYNPPIKSQMPSSADLNKSSFIATYKFAQALVSNPSHTVFSEQILINCRAGIDTPNHRRISLEDINGKSNNLQLQAICSHRFCFRNFSS